MALGRNRSKGARRWALTAEERERIAESGKGPVGPLEVLRALASKPALVPNTFRNAVRGASSGLRNDPELSWWITTRRMRESAPEAATGATWAGAEEFVKVLEPYLTPSTRALEVGAGAGLVSRLVAPRVGELIWTDLSKPMIDEAKENLAGIDGVRFVLADAGNLPALGLDPVDLIYAHNVLVTFDPDPAVATLDSMRRVLRPGGVCVVSYLTIDHEEWAQGQIDRIRSIGASGHFGATHPRAYVSAQADAMMKLAGFDLVESRYGADPDPGGPARPHYHVVGRVPEAPAGAS